MTYPFPVGKLRAEYLNNAIAPGYNLASTRVGFSVRRAAVQSIPNSVATNISWDTEDEDTDGFISVTSTTATIPAGKAGLYVITYKTTPPNLTVSARTFSTINLGGTLPTGVPNGFRGITNVNEDICHVVVTTPLVAASTIICDTFHAEGSAQNYTAWLSCYRIGP